MTTLRSQTVLSVAVCGVLASALAAGPASAQRVDDDPLSQFPVAQSVPAQAADLTPATAPTADAPKAGPAPAQRRAGTVTTVLGPKATATGTLRIAESEAYCPAGQIVEAHGHWIPSFWEDTNKVPMTAYIADRPVKNDQGQLGWKVTISQGDVQTIVDCVTAPAGTQTVAAPAAPNKQNPDRTATMTQPCPTGTHAIAGGYELFNLVTFNNLIAGRVLGSGPQQGGWWTMAKFADLATAALCNKNT